MLLATYAGNLVKSLPSFKGLFTTDSDVLKKFYKGKEIESKSLSLSPITADFVYKEFCALNPTKSMGLDGIPGMVL